MLSGPKLLKIVFVSGFIRNPEKEPVERLSALEMQRIEKTSTPNSPPHRWKMPRRTLGRSYQDITFGSSHLENDDTS